MFMSNMNSSKGFKKKLKYNLYNHILKSEFYCLSGFSKANYDISRSGNLIKKFLDEFLFRILGSKIQKTVKLEHK